MGESSESEAQHATSSDSAESEGGGVVVADRVRTILHEIADDKSLEILNLTVQPDHVHLFVSSPPKHAPSLLANWFKGISSRKYNHYHADYDGEKIEWARGYYAGTAGYVSSETITNYIQRHEEDDS